MMLTKHSYDWDPGTIHTSMSAAVISEQDDRKHLFSNVPAGTMCVYDVEPGSGILIYRAWQCRQTSVHHVGGCHCPFIRI